MTLLAAFVICTSTINAESGTENEPTESTETETNEIETLTDGQSEENNEGQSTVESDNSSAVEAARFLSKNRMEKSTDINWIAQNNHYELYLEEESLSIIIRDKNTSAVMYSTVANPDTKNNVTWQNFMKSGVSLEYLTGSNVNVNKVSMFTDGVQKEIMVSNTGFSAKVFVPDLEIGFTISMRINGYRTYC